MAKKLTVIFCACALAISAFADDKADAIKAVDTFYSEYIASALKGEDGDKAVKRSKHLSPAFKKAYAALQAKAWKENPESGLGYDPIVCGQDFPDTGYAVKSVSLKEANGSAKLSSKDPNFKNSISVTLVKQEGQWLINGIEDLKGK